MLLAHAPAGYLVARLLSRTVFKNSIHHERTDRLYQRVIFIGILGGILPDFDFIYKIFIDSTQASHHSYLTHVPIFWIGIWGIFLFIGNVRKDVRLTIIGTTLCVSALMHLVLDTLTGIIHWLYPFSNKGYNIFKVADIHIWWVKNYMYHWTFLIEIAIIVIAMVVFLRVKETIADLLILFKTSNKLRMIFLRFAVCFFGIGLITLVGSLRFNIDNRFVHKMIQLKNAFVRMVIS